MVAGWGLLLRMVAVCPKAAVAHSKQNAPIRVFIGLSSRGGGCGTPRMARLPAVVGQSPYQTEGAGIQLTRLARTRTSKCLHICGKGRKIGCRQEEVTFAAQPCWGEFSLRRRIWTIFVPSRPSCWQPMIWLGTTSPTPGNSRGTTLTPRDASRAEERRKKKKDRRYFQGGI